MYLSSQQQLHQLQQQQLQQQQLQQFQPQQPQQPRTFVQQMLDSNQDLIDYITANQTAQDPERQEKCNQYRLKLKEQLLTLAVICEVKDGDR